MTPSQLRAFHLVARVGLVLGGGARVGREPAQPVGPGHGAGKGLRRPPVRPARPFGRADRNRPPAPGHHQPPVRAPGRGAGAARGRADADARASADRRRLGAPCRADHGGAGKRATPSPSRCRSTIPPSCSSACCATRPTSRSWPSRCPIRGCMPCACAPTASSCSCRPAIPWPAPDASPLAALADQELVLRERGSITREVLEQAMAAADIRPRSIVEVQTREGVREAVAAGFGIGAIFASELGEDRRFRPVAVSTPISRSPNMPSACRSAGASRWCAPSWTRPRARRCNKSVKVIFSHSSEA